MTVPLAGYAIPLSVVSGAPLATAVALLAVAVSAPPLDAEAGQRIQRSASFNAGTSLGDGNTALALTAGLQFRFTERLGMDVELAYARHLDFTLDLCPPPLVCIRGGQLPVTGRTVALIPHVVADLLPASRTVRMYLVAGAGAGHVRQRYYDRPPPLDEAIESTRSSLTVALSFGGGAEMRISNRLAVGADVRSLHLLDKEASPDKFITPDGVLSTVRIAFRASWQF